MSVIDSFDTDTLGTFTSEVPRFGNQLDAARRKAQLATELSGCPSKRASRIGFF